MNPNTHKDEMTPLMNFTTEQLSRMPESMLLRLVIDFYQLQHPEQKALDAIAYELGLTVQCISNYLAGKGHVGFAGLRTLADITGCELIAQWIDAIWKAE